MTPLFPAPELVSGLCHHCLSVHLSLFNILCHKTLHAVSPPSSPARCMLQSMQVCFHSSCHRSLMRKSCWALELCFLNGTNQSSSSLTCLFVHTDTRPHSSNMHYHTHPSHPSVCTTTHIHHTPLYALYHTHLHYPLYALPHTSIKPLSMLYQKHPHLSLSMCDLFYSIHVA